MKETLKLENPIMIDDCKVEELTYDAMEITPALYAKACAKAAEAAKTKEFSLNLRESDYALHLYLGFMAIIAVNPKIDVMDLERCKGYDILTIADIGMLFMLRRLEAISDKNNSGERSETTAGFTTQAQQTSNEND